MGPKRRNNQVLCLIVRCSVPCTPVNTTSSHTMTMQQLPRGKKIYDTQRVIGRSSAVMDDAIYHNVICWNFHLLQKKLQLSSSCSSTVLFLESFYDSPELQIAMRRKYDKWIMLTFILSKQWYQQNICFKWSLTDFCICIDNSDLQFITDESKWIKKYDTN